MAFTSADARDVSGATDEKLWRELTLAQLWTRSCPNFYDDHEISDGLRKLSSVITLPWEIDSELFERELWKENR